MVHLLYGHVTIVPFWPFFSGRAPMFLGLNIKALKSREDPGSRPDPSRY